MLKLHVGYAFDYLILAAAFGRLCVETYQVMAAYTNLLAAAFGRLCVETNYGYGDVYSGGSSRLRAAVC